MSADPHPTSDLIVLYEARPHAATETIAQRLRDIGKNVLVVSDPSIVLFYDGNTFVEISDVSQDPSNHIRREQLTSPRGALDNIKMFGILGVVDETPEMEWPSELMLVTGTIVQYVPREEQLQMQLEMILTFAAS